MSRLYSTIASGIFALSASTFSPALSQTVEENTRPAIGLAAPAYDSAVEVTPGSALPLASGGTVLVFVRSADWCRFCKSQLIELNPISAPLSAAGWNLKALSYDSVETLAAFAEENDLPYRLLSDPNSRVIDAFGLRNNDVRSGSRMDGIPHPAIVYISEDGLITAVLREEGFRVRPTPESILDMALQLNSDTGG